MVDSVRAIMSGRWARPLAIIAILPSLALSQSRASSCAPSPPRRTSSSHWVAPEFVYAWRDSLLVLGSPVAEMRTDAAGTGVVDLDSMFAGMLVAPDGRARKVPLPTGTTALRYPRGIVRSPGRVEVIWADDLPRSAGEVSGPPTFRLRAATIVDGRWADSSVLGEMKGMTMFTRSSASEIVRDRDGIHYFAFRVDPILTSQPTPLLAIASDSGGRWRVNRFALPLRGSSALDLLLMEGRLTLLYAGIPDRLGAGVTLARQSIHLTRFVDGAWTAPQQVAGDGTIATTQPRLFPSASGPIAGWIERGGGNSLVWGRVREGGSTGPLHRLEGVVWLWRAQTPFEDLATVVTVEGRALVLRLRADGHDLIADLPAVLQLPPTVADVGGRPWAFVSEPSVSPDPGAIRVVGYDLGCALRPGGTPVRR